MENTTINKESGFINLPTYSKETQLSNALAAKERSKELQKKKFKYSKNSFIPNDPSSYREDGWKMVNVNRLYTNR